VPADQVCSIATEQRGGVARFLHRLVIAPPVERAVARCLLEVVDPAGQLTVEIVEPALSRPLVARGVAKVPLADERGVVACFFQRLGQQTLVGGQPVAAEPLNLHGLHAIAQRIAAGERGGTSLRRERLHIELLESCTGSSQTIERRCLNGAAMVADVLPA